MFGIKKSVVNNKLLSLDYPLASAVEALQGITVAILPKPKLPLDDNTSIDYAIPVITDIWRNNYHNIVPHFIIGDECVYQLMNYCSKGHITGNRKYNCKQKNIPFMSDGQRGLIDPNNTVGIGIINEFSDNSSLFNEKMIDTLSTLLAAVCMHIQLDPELDIYLCDYFTNIKYDIDRAIWDKVLEAAKFKFRRIKSTMVTKETLYRGTTTVEVITAPRIYH